MLEPASPPGEPVRLVIWDLDDTFWRGTLAEGGIKWRPRAEQAVRELARRGIPSAICSKNDPAAVEAVLEQRGLREFFVFPSISWDPKGPRLARLLEAVQLRAPSVLFIDDNPMNRAEARHFVPGLQVADETIVPRLLDDPRLHGKPDPHMTRLAQYHLLERRATGQQAADGDTEAFLRASNITVTIEHDLEPHLDRAVELTNRTNQLNFTKKRLPEDPEQARTALRTLLAEHTVQAGLLRVHDDYGDYGFCGLYVLRNHRSARPSLLHYAFSCRTLGMGIESWLYQRLGRPVLKVAPPVVTDVIGDLRSIDWVRVAIGDASHPMENNAPPLTYVLARGACDMRALSHYFGMVAGRVVEEFDTVRNGLSPSVCHSVIAAQAIAAGDPANIPQDFVRDCAALGYAPEDFATLATAPPAGGPAAWLLSFTSEQFGALFRHRATGYLIPLVVAGLPLDAPLMRADPAHDGAHAALLAHLRAHFDCVDTNTDALFKENLRALLVRAGPSVRVFILLANDTGKDNAGQTWMVPVLSHRNAMIAEVAAEFPGVELVQPNDFMSESEVPAQKARHHFDRMVYFRMFQHILRRVG
jgi:FkbH-like protein